MNPAACPRLRNAAGFWIELLSWRTSPAPSRLLAGDRSVTFVVERAGKSWLLRPSCCGVTPWLSILSNSSPESLRVRPALDCRRTTKASTRLSPGGSQVLALVNASGPQIEVRGCLPCRSFFILCRKYREIRRNAHTTASISLWATTTSLACRSRIARRNRTVIAGRP